MPDDERTLHSMLPDPDHVLALEPEELARFVLECIKGIGEHTRRRNSFIHLSTVSQYPRDKWDPIMKALSEAWAWLESHGLIAHTPGAQADDFVFITRRGAALATPSDFQTFRQAKLLPKELLHTSIAEKVWPLFLRGDYDTAVFQAFKEVEVAVRNAGGYAASDYAQTLMRRAFHTDAGPLRDQSAEPSERQARLELFSGSIGSYKNPSSHRHVTIGPQEAAEMISLASHLLRIVDSRRPAPAQP